MNKKSKNEGEKLKWEKNSSFRLFCDFLTMISRRRRPKKNACSRIKAAMDRLILMKIYLKSLSLK